MASFRHFMGGVRGKRNHNSDTSTRQGLFGVDELFIGRQDNKWQSFVGQYADNPAEDADAIYAANNNAPSGLYYIRNNNSDTDLAWCEINYQGTGKSYVLIFSATNVYGYTANWWKGQYMNTSVFESSSGTMHANWTGLVKKNLKLETWNHFSWNELLIIEDHNNDVSWKSYKHSSVQPMNYYLGGSTERAWYYYDSDMISGGTGRRAFTSNRIGYNYSLSNDGGRLVADPPSNECSGGFNTHVDSGTGYNWKGNITRNDSGRHYNSDGSTDNHTCWFLGRTWN